MEKQNLNELIKSDIRAMYLDNVGIWDFIKLHTKTIFKMFLYKIKSRLGTAIPISDKTKHFKQIISYLGGKINVSSRKSDDII